jgi:hypothetical protein
MAEVYLPLHSRRRLIRISRKTLKELVYRHEGAPAKSGDARLGPSIYRCFEISLRITRRVAEPVDTFR